MKVKVLSWNIWCGTHLDKVINFLETANADILALQEVTQDERGNVAEIIANTLEYQYVYTTDVDMPLKYLPDYDQDNERTIKMGNAILSKYEILDSKEHYLFENKGRSIIEAKIKIKDTVLNVFSIHLKHTHQQQLNLQDLQAGNLLQLLPQENTIVMGDFNSLPESGVIQRVSKVLQNTEKESHQTPTWSVYREGCTECLIDKIVHKLDYIFISKNLRSNSFHVYQSKASDHLPVSVMVAI